MSYFHGKLWALLPDIYRLRDSQGDLDALLRVISPELDDLKALMEAIPDQVDVDKTPEKFLPYLAGLVGVSLQGLPSSQARRRAIREAIEGYRRKGTVLAVLRDLDAVGWHGELQETFRDTLRLNRRSRVGKARIPGRIFSFGAYRIISEHQVQNLRAILQRHHPAGTKPWFWQWLTTYHSVEADFAAWLIQDVQRVAFVDLNETFQLNRNPLNADRHLTRKKTFWEVAHVTQNSTLHHRVTDAAVCQTHWHARGPAFTTNRDRLNRGQRFPNLWVSERRFSECCPVVQSQELGAVRRVLKLSERPLNKARLSRVPSSCDVLFRQKDFLSRSSSPQALPSDVTRTQTFFGATHVSRSFKLGSQLNGGTSLQQGASPGIRFTTLLAETVDGQVRAASNRVDRWQARRPGYRLNHRHLNRAVLSDGHVTSARAAFSSKIDVAASANDRVRPTRLNQHRLNRRGLRLTDGLLNPIRLGRMPLNQSGLKHAQPSEAWHDQQRDWVTQTGAEITNATNIITAAIWPEGAQRDTTTVFG